MLSSEDGQNFRQAMIELAVEDARTEHAVKSSVYSIMDDSTEDLVGPFAQSVEPVLNYYCLSGPRDAEDVLVGFFSRKIREHNHEQA